MGFSDVIKKAFPFISAAASLGGPVGTMAATLVGKAIGAQTAPAANADSISEAIATAFADPQQRAALIAAEQQFQAQMAELGYKDAEDLAATAEADRVSARQREMTLKDKVPAAMAFVVTFGFFGVLYFMLFHTVPNAAHDALLLLLGSLGTAWTAIISYYFGSSAGSDRKTELLAQSSPVPAKK